MLQAIQIISANLVTSNRALYEIDPLALLAPQDVPPLCNQGLQDTGVIIGPSKADPNPSQCNFRRGTREPP